MTGESWMDTREGIIAYAAAHYTGADDKPLVLNPGDIEDNDGWLTIDGMSPDDWLDAVFGEG